MSRIAFFTALSFAVLAIIGGTGIIMIGFRDYTRHTPGPFLFLTAGIVLLALAFLAEKPGSSQKIFALLRNALIALFVAAILAAIALAIRGAG